MPSSKKAIALQSLSSNLPEFTPPSRGKTQGTMFTSFSSYDLRMEFLSKKKTDGERLTEKLHVHYSLLQMPLSSVLTELYLEKL
jgi:hypothetical protein